MNAQPTPPDTETTDVADPSALVEGAKELAEVLRTVVREAADKNGEGEDLDVMRSEIERWAERLVRTGETASDEARLQAHLGLLEVRDRVEASRDEFERRLASWRDGRKGEIDHARLQAKLGSLELKEAVEDRRRRAEHLAAHVRRDLEHPAMAIRNGLLTTMRAWSDLVRNVRD